MLDQDPAMIEEMHQSEEARFAAPLTLYDDLFVVAYEAHETLKDTRSMSIEKPTLLLYSRSSCPFCRKVNNYLKSIDKSIPTKDIGKDPAAAKELVKIGGKQQVPCLVINGKPLYESSDIIAWLKENPNKY